MAPKPMDPKPIAKVCAAIAGRDGFGIEPWREAWANVLVAAWNDPEIAAWNPVPPEPTVELATSWIRGAASQNEASIGIDVVMVDAVSGVPAGEIGLQVDPAQGIAELGFWLSASFRGAGIGRTLLDLAADLAVELELVGLVALVDAENNPAIALCEAAGWPELPTKSERRAFAYRTS